MTLSKKFYLLLAGIPKEREMTVEMEQAFNDIAGNKLKEMTDQEFAQVLHEVFDSDQQDYELEKIPQRCARCKNFTKYNGKCTEYPKAIMEPNSGGFCGKFVNKKP